MKKLLLLLALVCIEKAIQAQTRPPYIYTIKADSVLITNSCDTAELILENHTQNVPGFLFNKGRGRTEFRRMLQKISDTLFLVGADSLKLPNAWLQGGNTFGSTGILGTRDNNHVDFITNNMQRGRFTNTGNLLLGSTVDDGNKLQVQGSISLKGAGGRADVVSPTFPVLIGDEGTGGGTAFLFESDATGRQIIIGGENGNKFHKFRFQTLGQGGDSIAAYNFTYNSAQGHALNIFNAAEGQTKLLLTAPGNLLIGTTADEGLYKLDVNGVGRFNGGLNVLASDRNYDVMITPNYGNGFAEGIDGSIINFGHVYGQIGVNKQDDGIIPQGSLLVGRISPGRIAAMIDYNGNPTFVTDGTGQVTINGGYSGITRGGGTGLVQNSNSYVLNINGCRGTGSGTSGDIVFSTGNTQASGTTIHTLTTRWLIKGGTGDLSNSPNPTSLLDLTGVNGFSQLRLRASYTPSSSSDTNGNVGDVSWDDNYLYIKTSTGWKRTTLSSF